MPDPIVKIDTTRLQAAILSVLPATNDRTRILRGLGAAAVATWKKIALSELRSSSRDYVAGISAPVVSDKSVEITLEGRLPNMVEQGWDGGDMREWLLSGPNAKQGKNGPYNVIPFRHGSPGTGGRNVGNEMPESIYALAKKLAPTISRPGQAVGGQGGRTTVWGERLHLGMPMKDQARAILETKKQPWHHSSIYLGMVRKAQPTRSGRLQSSGFITFRTISRYSAEPGKHWVHPGIRARNLVQKVEAKLDEIAQAIVQTATSGGQR